MTRMWVRRGVGVVVAVVVGALVVGVAVMLLWNWLMPAVFGLPAIGFWQAVGLLVLSKLLFGRFHARVRDRGGRFGPWRARMAERWAHMTEEERAQFRAGMRWRCGPSSAADGEPEGEPKG
jgi:hypothetical protein